MDQPQGSYPRVTGSDIQSGKYTEMLVSVVGKKAANNGTGGGKYPGPGTMPFETADGSIVILSTDQLEGGLLMDDDPTMVYEIIGAVSEDGSISAFVRRELGCDMDMKLYHQMIQLQKSSAMKQFFVQ